MIEFVGYMVIRIINHSINICIVVEAMKNQDRYHQLTSWDIREYLIIQSFILTPAGFQEKFLEIIVITFHLNRFFLFV